MDIKLTNSQTSYVEEVFCVLWFILAALLHNVVWDWVVWVICAHAAYSGYAAIGYAILSQREKKAAKKES